MQLLLQLRPARPLKTSNKPENQTSSASRVLAAGILLALQLLLLLPSLHLMLLGDRRSLPSGSKVSGCTSSRAFMKTSQSGGSSPSSRASTRALLVPLLLLLLLLLQLRCLQRRAERNSLAGLATADVSLSSSTMRTSGQG